MLNKLNKMPNIIWYDLIKAGVTRRKICSRKLALFIPLQSILDILVQIVPCGHTCIQKKVIWMWSSFKTGFLPLYIAAEYQQGKLPFRSFF